MMRANIRGTDRCCKAAVTEMKKNQYGKIINISSAHGAEGAARISCTT